MSRSSSIPSLWRPLRASAFRNLLLADVVSDIGTFMQSVGAGWLMVSVNAGPMYVALTQTASASRRSKRRRRNEQRQLSQTKGIPNRQRRIEMSEFTYLFRGPLAPTRRHI